MLPELPWLILHDTSYEQRQKILNTFFSILISEEFLTKNEADCLTAIAKTLASPVKGMIVYLIENMTSKTQTRWTLTIQLLLERTPPFEKQDYAYFFRKAAKVTVVDCLQILVDLKLPINAYLGNASLLDHAIMQRNTALVQRLLHIPEIALNNQEPTCGFTPLHYAVQAKQLAIIQLLLEKHVNIHLTSTYGWTPLALAVRANDVPIVVLFKQFYPLLVEMPIGKFAKKIAVEHGYKEIADLLTVRATHKNEPGTLQKIKNLLFSQKKHNNTGSHPEETSRSPLLTAAERAELV